MFLTSVDEMRNCKDSTGAVTGLPDIPFVSTALVQQCSDQSFPIAPPQVLCDTATDHPQTFQANVARGHYYLDKYGKDLHGVYVFGSDSKSARDCFVRQPRWFARHRRREPGHQVRRRLRPFELVRRSRSSPEIVQKMKSSGSNYGQAQVRTRRWCHCARKRRCKGLTGVKVWDCGVQCYDKLFIDAGGADVEDQYSDLLFLPFYNKADQKANPMLANVVKYVGADKLAGYSMYAWAAGLAFRDAVNAQVKAGGVNSVTRKTIFEQLNKINKFDADGIIAPIDLAGREASGCSVLNQLKNGELRAASSPTKPGTFACPKNGRILRKLDLFTNS